MRLSYHWRQDTLEFLKMTSMDEINDSAFHNLGRKFSRPDWPDQFEKFIFDVIWVSFTRSKGINKRFYSSLENIIDAWWVISKKMSHFIANKVDVQFNIFIQFSMFGSANQKSVKNHHGLKLLNSVFFGCWSEEYKIKKLFTFIFIYKK